MSEQMGGLSTPRPPAEIQGDKVLSSEGVDVTKQYLRGAQTALFLAQLNNVDFAILKSKSPSCGKGQIYDGTFSGKMRSGQRRDSSASSGQGHPRLLRKRTGQLPL